MTSKRRCRRTTPNWSFGNNDHAYIDIGIALPVEHRRSKRSIRAAMRPSKISTSLQLQDSSGDLDDHAGSRAWPTSATARVTSTIDDAGSVRVRDSSGDIEIDGRAWRRRRGARTAPATSTSRRSAAACEIEQDSSGGIRVEDVKGSVVVDSDSSGDIYAGARRRRLHRERRQLGQHRARGRARRTSRCPRTSSRIATSSTSAELADQAAPRGERQQRETLGLLAQQRAEVVPVEEAGERRRCRARAA